MAAVTVVGWQEVIWRVVPLATPTVIRHCAKCGRVSRFVCSEMFRLNAQHRKVDVWLIYRCAVCETTWNCTIFSRRAPEEIGGELYPRLQENDRDTAWRYAFDLSLLERAGGRADAEVPVQVQHIPSNGMSGVSGRLRVVLELLYPCHIRLDRLLAEELQVSRACVERWIEGGALEVLPAEAHVLRRPARHGQMLLLTNKARNF